MRVLHELLFIIQCLLNMIHILVDTDKWNIESKPFVSTHTLSVGFTEHVPNSAKPIAVTFKPKKKADAIIY